MITRRKLLGSLATGAIASLLPLNVFARSKADSGVVAHLLVKTDRNESFGFKTRQHCINDFFKNARSKYPNATQIQLTIDCGNVKIIEKLNPDDKTWRMSV